MDETNAVTLSYFFLAQYIYFELKNYISRIHCVFCEEHPKEVSDNSSIRRIITENNLVLSSRDFLLPGISFIVIFILTLLMQKKIAESFRMGKCLFINRGEKSRLFKRPCKKFIHFFSIFHSLRHRNTRGHKTSRSLMIKVVWKKNVKGMCVFFQKRECVTHTADCLDNR